ncbi:PIN domain-containing protein [Candidatus Pacearchaeota archaeon]|nr:PIN domain-containing protein [Candidatus Pacearchaeota archaeon]
MNLEGNSITIEENEKEEDFFFDTYAIYEIIRENKNYSRYLNVGIVTTKLNLFELYFKFLNSGEESLAELSLNKYCPFAVDFDEEVIKEAAKLKKFLNKRDVSMTDCIGYALAKQWGIRFLTGDNAFKDSENVEFVK